MRTNCAFAVLAVSLLSACQPASDASQPATTKQSAGGASEAPAASSALPSFVGTAWMSMDRGQPLGSIRIFLPNKSLLMDSCFETFRIVEWGVVSADTIRWREDSIPIQAQWSQPTPDSLTLKVAGMDEAQTYVAASVPYLCPDMPK